MSTWNRDEPRPFNWTDYAMAALTAQSGERVGVIGHVSHDKSSITAAVLSMAWLIERTSMWGCEWFCAGKERWTKRAHEAILFPSAEAAKEAEAGFRRSPEPLEYPRDEEGAGDWVYHYDITEHVFIHYAAQPSVRRPTTETEQTADTVSVPGEKRLAFQWRVQPWMFACFGQEIATDITERNYRFLEESLELVQSTGCKVGEAHQIVDYVFNRPVGDPDQEVGGVMVTLAALCLASGLDMHQCGEVELTRVWGAIERIRAKQASKPKLSLSPLQGGK